jgi:2,4-dienoyl-CoA reductase-like NADH-dependent reductase (Old Yellow Enzyme family)
MEDGFRGGMTLDEGIQVARWIEQDGHCDALQLTGGHTTKTPMFLMRGDVPLREMIANERNHVRRWGMRLFAPFMIQEYRFTEAFFMESAKRFRATVTMPIMLLGGITKLATMREAMSAGFEFVAMGRGLIRDPDLVNRMIAGELSASRCIPCNRCVAEMERSGTRCVYRDDAVRDRLQAG